MSRIVTFTNDQKGAFRIDVSGRPVSNQSSALLTGIGDVCEIELAEGTYRATVTNVGTGHAFEFDFQVESADATIPIHQAASPIAGGWRSVGGKPSGIKKPGWTGSKLPIRYDSNGGALDLKCRATWGWSGFSGTAKLRSDLPGLIKIERSSQWLEQPVVRVSFDTSKERLRAYFPLFAGGTLLSLESNGGRSCLGFAPCDAKTLALVGGLERSFPQERLPIVRYAAGTESGVGQNVSIGRSRDPWTSAASALLLIRSGEAKALGSAVVRHAMHYHWLADFGVIAAWSVAAQRGADEEKCLDLVQKARRDGHVYFWPTYALAEQLLSALTTGKRSAEFKGRARREYAKWKNLKSTASPAGAFSSWREEL
ncbi:hypothetical protein [Pelagibacterium montanilacus]|uniref:hypothetical protein n=1 Tax=Pelagibacterium montanilacus TaxID=2185280 RepID=UPI000F8EA821|nr:hypothetical protein [Pelagibacterium montanilacus]